MNQKITEFTTFGSCSSRNIFNSTINKNYKEFFRINDSIEGVTLISLMSSPVSVNSKLLNSKTKYDNICVKEDLTKNYLEFLKESSHIDYLIMDTSSDVIYGIIVVDDDTFISNSDKLRKTALYDEYDNYRKYNLVNEFNEYFRLWRSACYKFFEFMDKHCKDIKIILNCSRSVPRYLKDGEIHYNPFLNKRNIMEHNKYRDILDKFILKNFDVEALPFNKNTLADANHLFGLSPAHYEKRYYSEKTRQLNDIIDRNRKISYNNKKNKYYRFLKRKNIINDFKIKNQLSVLNDELTLNEDKIHESYSDDYKIEINDLKLEQALYKYITARIDIKNEGSEDNSIEILENSDNESRVSTPPWFKNNLGIGTQIYSKNCSLDIKLKCINDGKLKIGLKGLDFKNENHQRIPIYIKYTTFLLNNKKILKKPIITWHDEPYVFYKDVKDSEILNLSIKWSSI